MTLQPRPETPAQAWAALKAGNARFVAGTPEHPNQDAARRGELTGGQAPFATLFGCGDSRCAAEVIFDQGLGDLFVVRTAGHVIHEGVLGSLEFGTEVLGVPLIVILGHDSCGAVKAAVQHYQGGSMPGGFIRDIVERVTPSVIAAANNGSTATDEVEAEHVRQTMRLIDERSQLIHAAVEEGRCAIVGLTYALAEGNARLVSAIGDIGEG
ncbi:MAG: carbonic anhydrase [Austwickia sp.]|jgi:carbonic anhydrase|nr:MAG: carbonic anhydrase [Austwickia sp.]